jgi:zeaxanthin glucosyltransferase
LPAGERRTLSHIGFICFPGAGHLIPAIALGRRLQERGHRVTFFHSIMARPRLTSAGLGFWQLENQNYLNASGSQTGWPCLPGADLVQRLQAHAQCILQEGPSALSGAGVDALIVDQAALGGGSVAELLRMPFATVCFFPPVIIDSSVPQTVFPWSYRNSQIARIRNQTANLFIRAMLQPVLSTLNLSRSSWNLTKIRSLNEATSQLAILSQMPESFDFPHEVRCPHLFYTGPFQDAKGRWTPPFPWDLLDGRDLVYASLGTVRNDMPHMFRVIAEACASQDLQLVLSLGGGRLNPEDLGLLPGNPIVVHYAPQLDLLRRARLTITHAGMNTTLESLAEGVPLVAIPLADDQPGVSARITWTGVGTVVHPRSLSVKKLRSAVQETISQERYRSAAQAMQHRIGTMDGARAGAQIIERVFRLKSLGAR